NNIAGTDAGNYSVTVTNLFGSTNSSPATLTVLVPAPGSYAASVLANVPYGYWLLDDTDLVMRDFYGGHDGAALDPTNTTFGVTASLSSGFAATHKGVFIPNNGHYSRV